MNHLRVPYTVYDISNFFGKKDFDRGVDYANEKRVIKLTVDREGDTLRISSQVQGTSPTPYKSLINVSSRGWKISFKNECSCPLGGNCKHVVASLLTLKSDSDVPTEILPQEDSIEKPLVRLTIMAGDVKWKDKPWSSFKTSQKILATLQFAYPSGTVDCFKKVPDQQIQRHAQYEESILEEMTSHGWQNIISLGHTVESITFPEATFVLKPQVDSLAQLAESFYFKVIPQLKMIGWEVEIDTSFPFRPIENVGEWYADLDQKAVSSTDWFDLEMGIMIEGQRVNILPLLVKMIRSAENPDDLLKLKTEDTFYLPMEDGRVLPIPGERINYIARTLLELHTGDVLTKDGKLRLSKWQSAQMADMEAAMQATQMRWFGNEQIRDLGNRLRDFTKIELVPLPQGLQSELRPYQLQGLSWLQFLREQNLNGILADDMGLGKTIQTLSHILHEKESGRMTHPVLVIAPTSLMTNWRNEAHKFAPSLKVLVLQGYERKESFDQIPNHDLVLTTYPLLSRDKDILLKHRYHLLILDEAQTVKNPNTMAHRIVQQIQANHRLCLTGTPMENHLGELWSLFHFLMPGFLGDQKQFAKLFRTPIEKIGDEERRQLLVKRVRPFIMRRTKQQVVSELPPKTEIIQNIDLLPKQRDLYESIRLTMHDRIQNEISEKGLNRSQIVILDALLKLRQVCCDPRLLKIEAAKSVIESAKLQFLEDTLPEMIEEGRRVLLFSQFTSMLELIEQQLTKQNLAYVKLTGQTKDRATPIEEFQSGKVPLFLISLKAGGTGLNLTAADTVIHFDPWWNPAVENQATDRAYRIGQDKPVFVYKLVTTGTVEEKILAMQQRKAELLTGIFDPNRQSDLSFSQEDLEALFEPLA
jgi:superfamily II DNA or RNA helicase